MNGLQRIIRRDIMARLKAAPAVLALVPSASIHGQTTDAQPSSPFIKLGPPTTTPRRASGLNDGTVLVSVHGFARARDEGGSVVETAEDHAGRIGAAIEAALDRAGGQISDGVKTGHVRYLLADRQLLVDGGEEDAFHWFANVLAKVTAA